MKRSTFLLLLIGALFSSGCHILTNSEYDVTTDVYGTKIHHSNLIEAPNNLNLIKKYYFLPMPMTLRTATGNKGEIIRTLEKDDHIYVIGETPNGKWLAVALMEDSPLIGYISNEPRHYPPELILPPNVDKRLLRSNYNKKACIKAQVINGMQYCPNSSGTYVLCESLAGNIKICPKN